MGQIKRLSVNDVMRITGVSAKQCKKVTWHTSEFIVRNLLPLGDFLNTVNSILTDCEANDGTVDIGLIDFALRKNIIVAYAFINLPDDVDQLYYVVYASDLFDAVCSAINQEQLKALFKTISIYIGDLHG